MPKLSAIGGDGRAAVVLRTAPLLVAAYCDEMDAVMLLRFPGFLAGEHGLAEGTRLVTANLHRPGPGKVARDIVPGLAYLRRYINVRPLIADFLAAEGGLVEARRRAIPEREYRRCEELGRRALEGGQPVRSGRPLEAATPGTRRWDGGGLTGGRRFWGGKPAPHTTGAFAPLAILGRTTFALAIFALRAVAVLVRRMLWKGVVLMRGRPGVGGRSGR